MKVFCLSTGALLFLPQVE